MNCTGGRRLGAAHARQWQERASRALADTPDLRIDLVLVGSCDAPALGSSAALSARLALFNVSGGGAAAAAAGNGAPGASLVRLFAGAAANASGVSSAGVGVSLQSAAATESAPAAAAASPSSTALVVGVAVGAALLVLACCCLLLLLLARWRSQRSSSSKPVGDGGVAIPSIGGGLLTDNPMHAQRRSAPPSTATPAATATATDVPHPAPATPVAPTAALGFAVGRGARSGVRRRAPGPLRDGPRGAAAAASQSASESEEAPSAAAVRPASPGLSGLLDPDFAWRANPLSRRNLAASAAAAVRLPGSTPPALTLEATDLKAWKRNPVARRSAAASSARPSSARGTGTGAPPSQEAASPEGGGARAASGAPAAAHVESAAAAEVPPAVRDADLLPWKGNPLAACSVSARRPLGRRHATEIAASI